MVGAARGQASSTGSPSGGQAGNDRQDRRGGRQHRHTGEQVATAGRQAGGEAGSPVRPYADCAASLQAL